MDWYDITLNDWLNLDLLNWITTPLSSANKIHFVTSGSLSVIGCSHTHVDVYYDCEFGVGSTPFILEKAKKGILKQIFIKYVDITHFTGKMPHFVYIDNNNRKWRRHELIWRHEAFEIVRDIKEVQECRSEARVTYVLQGGK